MFCNTMLAANQEQKAKLNKVRRRRRLCQIEARVAVGLWWKRRAALVIGCGSGRNYYNAVSCGV